MGTFVTLVDKRASDGAEFPLPQPDPTSDANSSARS